MLLQLEGLTVRFGGVEALSRLDLALAPGQALGLMGPNGCGKTTLFNAVSGLVPAAAGRILFRGRDVTGLPAHAIARMGLARTFQTVRLFAHMTVADNLAPSDMPGSAARMEQLLETVGLAEKGQTLAGELTLEEQRRLEIARALGRSPALLLMDEPTAGLDPQETEAMVALIRRLVLPACALMLTEHKADVVEGLCPCAVLLDQGRKVREGPPAELFASLDFRRSYLGVGN
jgi:ABC-type branched-subunit amino acid transport system ATPase component